MIEIIVTSSVLILAILLVRILFKEKVSRRLQYGLWLLVVIRLLVPISITSPASVMNTMDAAGAEQFIVGQTIEVQPAQTLLDEGNSAQPDADANTHFSMHFPAIIRVVWIAGAAVVGIWFATVNITFYTRLRKKRRRIETANCKLPVYIVDSIPSPCLFGVFRPAIYLTEQACLNPRTTNHVVTHELCHYAHLDHVWSVVRCLCAAVYWFNPLVWIAAGCSRFDCELACDDAAVRRLGEEEKLAYGRTLIELVPIKISPSALVCTATTMTTSGKRMKERVSMIAKSPKTIFSALIVLLATLGIVVGCTFTGASKDTTAGQAADQLIQSILFENNKISFIIPENYKNTQDWNILVSGSVKAGDSNMSVHLFEEENGNQSWQAGKKYTIDTTAQDYQDLHMDVYLRSDESVDKSIDLLAVANGESPDTAPVYNTVSITFPAYQDGRNENNAAIYDIAPFILTLSMPDGWEVQIPNEENRVFTTPATPIDLYQGDTYMGYIGYNTFTPYESDIPKNQYYKTVYSQLRLSSMLSWDLYTPLKSTDTGETGIATVRYKDSDETDKHPGAMPDVPTIEVPGILSYDKEMNVYIAIQFAKGVVTDEQVRAIANSVNLSANSNAPDDVESPAQAFHREIAELDAAKAAFKAMSPDEQKIAIEQERINCTEFRHVSWEHMIDVSLIRYVGEESFATWTKLENQGCHSIYDFTRHFNLSADELAELIITNELDEIYDVEILKERYSQGA